MDRIRIRRTAPDRTWSVRRGIAHDPQCVYTRQIRPRNRRDGADWRDHCWRGCLRCKPDW